MWKALKAALSTRSGTASVLAFAVDWFCFFGLRLVVAGLLRCWLLCWVQAWEGEIRYLVHRRRSSQGLFFQSQVIPRSQKALAGYSTANDKKNFMSADVGTFIVKTVVWLERHLAQDHVAVHHKIPQKAVERVLEGRRAVLFEEEVADPGKAVTGYRHGQQ